MDPAPSHPVRVGRPSKRHRRPDGVASTFAGFEDVLSTLDRSTTLALRGGALIWRGRPMTSSWDRDEAAVFVEGLFARHHSEIYAYLVRMLRDPELAADLTQDAFVKAYRAHGSLQKNENARAWLYQIAHRVALDELRRRRIIRMVPWAGESRGAAPSAERLAMDVRLSGPLERALGRIPERQRAALLLAEIHDLTGLELAAAMGVSHVAARAILTRARESLRKALAQEEEAELATEAERDGRLGQEARGGR